MATKVNYTAEQEKILRENYNPTNNAESIQKIMDILNEPGKNARSIRSKLVRMGIYVASPKDAAKKESGTSKKDLVAELCIVTGLEDIFDGMMPAHKNAIEALIKWAKENA